MLRNQWNRLRNQLLYTILFFYVVHKINTVVIMLESLPETDHVKAIGCFQEIINSTQPTLSQIKVCNVKQILKRATLYVQITTFTYDLIYYLQHYMVHSVSELLYPIL